MWSPDVCYCRDYIPRHSKAIKNLVHSDMADNNPKERGKRYGLAAGFGAKELCDCLDVVTQDPESGGTP
jgi:hypothetical protein